MSSKIELNREFLTTTQAAKQTGLSKNYLTQLLRQDKLEGFQLARNWVIYTDSLEKFLATPRKSGPKGPRKKPEQVSSTSTKNETNNASLE